MVIIVVVVVGCDDIELISALDICGCMSMEMMDKDSANTHVQVLDIQFILRDECCVT